MSAKPVLYYMTLSPPSRAVMMVAAALDIELELKTLNLLAMEHKTPEYLAVSTQSIESVEVHLISLKVKPKIVVFIFQFFALDKSTTHYTIIGRQWCLYRRQPCDCGLFV